MEISGDEVLSFSSTTWTSFPLSETALVSSVKIAVVDSSVEEIGAAELDDEGSGVSVNSSVVLGVMST